MTASIRITVFLVGLMSSLSAMASAVIERLTGTANAGARSLAVRQRVNAGETITTGAGSLLVMRFDDGHVVILNKNSELRIAEYAFDTKNPSRDRFVFDFIKGAMRAVTGLVTRRTENAYSVRAPQATIGIRGTDFMLSVENHLYMAVTEGLISATNAAGAVTFGAGATYTVATATTIATSIAVSALPAEVAASFNTMNSVAVAAGAASGTAGATGAAAGGGIGAGAIAAGVLGIAAAVSALSDKSTNPTTTSTTTTTTTR